ncbi:HBS1-like protein isoform X1 [Coccinella septempunctata]|uniref:HBS1-like protein isoform X1 n=1 Tax=Coccinella septempunctata TaxID=41139 RepID=UPI001D0884A3|nr:HBS1-like protein isoform X1 [Coccinella septempunctata]
MSRHRDIRNMDYSEDYDGYDDVYGHSVDDDIYISPSHRQFMYNRESSGQSKSDFPMEEDIQEEDETDEVVKLSEEDRAKLESCLDHVRSVFAPMRMSRPEIVKVIISQKFDCERIINHLLKSQSSPPTERRDKGFLPSSTTIPAKVIVPTSVNIIKGFEIDPSTTASRSESPSSGRGTPVVNLNQDTDEIKTGKKDVRMTEAQYKKERGDMKEHLYMIVIGHVDAGKSTLMGHILYAMGHVNQKTMHKYEQESKKLGKQSFMYAWVLDETGEERTRGITMDVGRCQFETKSKMVTLLDAPGHKDFIPNMISGAAQADVALLVVDATRGEFETGFDYGGQTREHALLVRSLGVTQLAVAVNKLDTVSWSQGRFDEIIDKMKSFLKQAGFKESDVTYVPCSGLTGQNLVQRPTEDNLLSWYNGPCLLEVIDGFRPPVRPVSKPFRLSINDIFKGTGSAFCISGRVETGALNVGDKVLICPNKEIASVKSLSIDELLQNVVFAGDQATVTLSGIDMQNVSVGNILCDPQNPVQVATKFEARIVVFNVTVPITKGYNVVLHHQSLEEPGVICKLVAELNKSTGEQIRKHPRFLGNNTSAIVQVQMSRPIALELYSECKELGRIMLRQSGVTIAAGLITKIIQ